MAGNFAFLERKETAGFTLFELLVVLGIIMVFSAMTLPAWKENEDSLALQRSSAKASQAVRKAAELSLSAVRYFCSVGQISGYGVYFSVSLPDSYIIFADCNNNQKYDGFGIDGVVESAELEKGILISAVSQGSFSAVFVPPVPEVFLKDGDGNQITESQVTVSLAKNPSAAKILSINQKGTVSVR